MPQPCSVNLQNPYLFVYVSLIHAALDENKKKSPSRETTVTNTATSVKEDSENDTETPSTTIDDASLMKESVISKGLCGQLVSSLHRLKDIDNSDAGFFIFP